MTENGAHGRRGTTLPRDTPQFSSIAAPSRLQDFGTVPDDRSRTATKPSHLSQQTLVERTSDSASACSSSFDSVFRSLRDGDEQLKILTDGISIPILDRALDDSLELADRAFALCQTIQKHDMDKNGSVQRLVEEADELCDFEVKSEKIVALLGTSGEGKSSLINAILGFRDLAPTGDTGFACTSVVTEFRQKKPYHGAAITLEVEYYTEAETEELLVDLVKNFRTVQLQPEKKSIEDEGALPLDKEQALARSDEAWSALSTAFGSHETFNREFLLDQSPGAFRRLTSQLVQWTSLLAWPEGAKDGKYTVGVSSEEECDTEMNLFMQDKFWPFTKLMRIFVDSDVLKAGIVLADLPGRSDTNTARIKAGQMYLNKCDHVFVLSDVARAVTNASLQSAMFEMLAKQLPLEWEMNGARNFQVTMICTKIDSINVKSNKRAFAQQSTPEFTTCLERLEKEMKKTTDEVLKGKLKQQIDALLIITRNNRVATRLRQGYQTKTESRQLDVFCVSSTMYDEWVDKVDGGDFAVRMLELSGIPDLRSFCRSLNQPERESEILNFIQSRLLGLLNTMDLCSAGPSIHIDPQAAEDLWEDTREKITFHVIDTGEQTKTSCLQPLANYFGKRTEFWKAKAMEEHKKWCKWHWKQIKAFCEHYGDYETERITPRVNWNRDILWLMASELTEPLDYAEEMSAELEALSDKVQQEVDDFKTTCEEGALPEAVIRGLDLRLSQLKFEIRVTEQKLVHHLSLIRRSALEANYASYVVKHMTPVYLSAMQEHGTGIKARQSGMLGAWIRDRLFQAMEHEITSNLTDAFETSFGELQTRVIYILRLAQQSIMAALVAPKNRVRYDDSFSAQVEELWLEYDRIAEELNRASQKPDP